MDLQLENRVALVAGSSRGIGKAIAWELLNERCVVCISGRDEALLASTAAEFTSAFGHDRVLSSAGDLTSQEEIDRTLATIAERWGGLDSVIANVGSGAGKPGWEQDEQEWQRLFRLNFHGSVRLAQAAIPKLIERGGGSILFVASIAGVEATPAPLAYSAAKAALINYGKNLARVVAQHRIRVNCVAPGNILFPGGSWEKHLAKRRPEVEQYIDSEVPLKRFGTAGEIASLAAFLCSDRAAFITGSCMVADGGQVRSI